MKQSAILTMGIVATIVNLYGAVKRGKPIEIPVLGGFVAVAILLGVGEAAPTIAELFAVAYLITSLSENGTTLLEELSTTTGGNAAASSGVAQSSPGGSPDIQRKA